MPAPRSRLSRLWVDISPLREFPAYRRLWVGDLVASGGSQFAAVALPYQVFAWATLLFILWKHKENIGRILDGVEPRLGEKPPLAGLDQDEVACAFMIHPMNPDDWWQTRRFALSVVREYLGLANYYAGFPIGAGQ